MWTIEEEASRLAARFEAVKNRADFARQHGVKGGGAMIYQHINGIKPISLSAAEAYARGFNCSLAEISPRLAAQVEQASHHLSPSGEGWMEEASAYQGAQKIPPPASMSRLKNREEYATIPEYADGGSMGHGLVLPDQPGVIHNWQVNREWLEKNARSHSGVSNLRIVTGFGPSMKPLFNPGDPLLVDIGVKSVIADGIYFFRVGDEGFIKQLQKIPTKTGIKYVAKSKNKDYDPFEIAEDMDFEVIGRVIRVWCGMDF